MRYAVAIGLVVLDWVTFFVPIGSLILAYVIIAKPKWFFDFLNKY